MGQVGRRRPSSWTASGGAACPTGNPFCDASLADGATPDGPADAGGLAALEADALGALEADALGAVEAEPDGPTDSLAIDGDAVDRGVGVGVGRSPTGSGPTNTNAARIPIATMTPVASPARIVTPDLMCAARVPVRTDRRRREGAAARMPIP